MPRTEDNVITRYKLWTSDMIYETGKEIKGRNKNCKRE